MTNEYHSIVICAVLDPRISYMALKDEFIDDPDLANNLEDAKAKLQDYFKQNYSRPSPQANSSLSAPSLSSVASTSMPSVSGSSGSPSVCKSGPVRSFGPKMQDRDRDWFTFVLEPKKTRPD